MNIYIAGNYTPAGAGALGLPGDYWNAMPSSTWTVSPALDAAGASTSISAAISGISFGEVNANASFTSPLTQGVLSSYAVGGGVFSSGMNILIVGLIPNTNYVLVSYMAGNGNGQGGTITWSSGVANGSGVIITNSAQALNNNVSTLSSFINGQNYAEIVVQSDGSGEIGNDGANTQTLVVTPNSNQGWVGCWDALQLQFAPNIPVMYRQPQSLTLFPGGTAHFISQNAGLPPLTYQWQQNGVNLTDGSGVSGSTTPSLTIANVSSSATYTLTTSNTNGTATGSAVLTVVTPTPGSYPAVADSLNPAAYWRLNENAGSSVAYEYMKGLNGSVGSGVTMGAAGVSDPGFEATHYGAQFVLNNPSSTITVPALNLDTNAVTITAWVDPSGAQNPGAALLLTRSGTGGAGLIYGPAANTLGYVWNNGSSATYGWNSGLNVPQNMWSFVALVIQPTKATLYVFNANGLSAAINPVPNNSEAWAGLARIGSDPADTVGTNNFNGIMDEVAVFSKALSGDQLYSLYAAALQSGTVAPSIIKQPASQAVSQRAIARFSVVAVGTGPLSYQWQENGTNLTDGSQISGSTTATLLINNAGANNAGSYDCVVTGSGSPVTSSSAALTISSRQLLFNVDLNSGGSPNASGAAVLGQSGDLWNDVNEASAANLADYSGNPSTVGITLSGAAFGYDPTGTTNTTALMGGYAYDYGTMGVSITGLNPQGLYRVVGYSAGNLAAQGGFFTGALSGMTTGDYRDPLTAGTNYLLFSNIAPSPAGALNFQIGYSTNGSGPSVLNGLQIQEEDISADVPIVITQPSAVVTNDTASPIVTLTQPGPQLTNYSGLPTILYVHAVSDTPITYQWMLNGNPLIDGGNISGANTAMLTINPTSMSDAGIYSVEMSNINGSTNSATATLTVLNGANGFTWSPPVPIGVSNYVADLTLPGEVVGAAQFGVASTVTPITVTLPNGTNILFTVDGSVATCSATGTAGGGFVGGTGNTNFDQALGSWFWNPNANTPYTNTLYGLTPGLRYSVQFFAIDDRGGNLGQRQVYLQDPVVPTDISQTWQQGNNVYVVGTFTATSTTNQFVEQLPGDYGTGNEPNNGNANAVVVYLAPPTVSAVNNHNGTVTLSWNQNPVAHLLSAPSLSGPWTDMGTTSPVTVPTTSGTKFFRAQLP